MRTGVVVYHLTIGFTFEMINKYMQHGLCFSSCMLHLKKWEESEKMFHTVGIVFSSVKMLLYIKACSLNTFAKVAFLQVYKMFQFTRLAIFKFIEISANWQVIFVHLV